MGNKYRSLQMPPKEDLEKLYNVDFKSQKEIGIVYNTTQKVIFSWFVKYGIKSRVAYKRNQLKENNSSWKGDNVTYAAFHYRVESQRGKPHFCEACGVMESTIFEWCNLTGKYEDVMDYARFCRKCHRKYDKNRLNSSKHVKRTIK
jgi:hypothetical protein